MIKKQTKTQLMRKNEEICHSNCIIYTTIVDASGQKDTMSFEKPSASDVLKSELGTVLSP